MCGWGIKCVLGKGQLKVGKLVPVSTHWFYIENDR